MTKRKLLQQALDALDHPCTLNDSIGWPYKVRELCDSIRAELAQPSATPTGYTKGYAEGFEDACQVAAHVKAAQPAVAEPVAWMGRNPRTNAAELATDKPAPSVLRDFNMQPLYAAPQAAVAEPLTERRIYELHEVSRLSTVRFARAIEQAHGIGIGIGIKGSA